MKIDDDDNDDGGFDDDDDDDHDSDEANNHWWHDKSKLITQVANCWKAIYRRSKELYCTLKTLQTSSS